jgi:uroporphyrinogen-III synthase
VRFLVTRPESDAERTAAALRQHGHVVVIAPLLRIEPILDPPIEAQPWGAILITSANAAAAIALHKRKSALLDIPVFAVGDRSAESMRATGFAKVISAGGAVADLMRLAVERFKPQTPLLYLAGEDRAADLAGALAAKGFIVQTVVLYRAVVAKLLPKDAVDALTASVDGVLHFSRRSAEAYVESARAAGVLSRALEPAQFCLSQQIAAPLRGAGAARIRVAAQPNETTLVELICGPAS